MNFCFFLYLVAIGSCGSMEVNGFLVPPFAVSNGKSISRD